METVVEGECRSLDRKRQTNTDNTGGEAQLTSDRDSRSGRSLTFTRLDRHRLTQTRSTNIEREAQLTSVI